VVDFCSLLLLFVMVEIYVIFLTLLHCKMIIDLFDNLYQQPLLKYMYRILFRQTMYYNLSSFGNEGDDIIHQYTIV